MKNRCQKIQPLLAGYALGAVDQDERDMIETHLEGCQNCQQQLQEYYRVREGILLSQPSTEPPQRLRRALVERTSQTSSPSWWEKWQTGWAPAFRVAVTVLVLAMLAANIGLFVQVRNLTRAQTRMQQQYQASQTTVALLTYYDTEVVELSSRNAYGTLIYEPDRELGVLNVRGLEPLAEDQTYQVWLIDEDQTRESGGLISVDEGTYDYVSHVIWSSHPLRDYTGIGITIEPAGGSPGPTGPKVLGTDL